MKAEVRRVQDLGASDIDDMYALYDSYFADASSVLFRHDLLEKDYAIILRDEQSRIQGFSTGKVITFAGGRAIFSGDTIIHHQRWGEQTLPLVFAAQAGRIKSQRPDVPLYWFLITKGYRTYRYLPLFFYDYFPRWDRPTPPSMQRLLDQLAIGRFGADYDPATGVVRFTEPHGHLREPWAEVREAVRRKPEVRYFLDRNPGYREGDELVCVAELSAENIRPFARAQFLAAAAPVLTL